MNRKHGSNRKFFVYIETTLLIIFFALMSDPIAVYADNGDTIVHITNTGACYHMDGCSHLRSDIEITLYDATKEGYVPCEDCNPPLYDGPPIEDAEPKREKHESTGSSHSRTTSDSKEISKRDVSIDKKEESFDWTLLIMGLVFAGIPVAFITHALLVWIKEKKAFEKERQQYNDLYCGKDPLSLVTIPDGVYLKDGYPCTDNKKKGIWGDYTVYVARKKRRVFHLNSQCGGTKLMPINYYWACRLPHCKKCAVGKIKLPELDWYLEYVKIKEIKEKYKIQ